MDVLEKGAHLAFIVVFRLVVLPAQPRRPVILGQGRVQKLPDIDLEYKSRINGHELIQLAGVGRRSKTH